MIKSNPVVIDGNLFLNTFNSAILGNMPDRDVIHNGSHEFPMYRGRGLVIKSFITFIFAHAKQMAKKGFDPTHFSIVWDKRNNGKYHKSTIIDTLGDGDSYKGDRTYVTIEDLQNPELSRDEREKIEAEVIRSNERFAARNFLESELPKYGIPSYSLSGWEADDLDFIWAKETELSGGRHIHCSGDSDWGLHLRPNDQFWQVNRAKLHLKSYEDVRKKHAVPEGMDLWYWAELQYSAFGSHNFLKRTFNPEVKRVTKKYKDKFFSGDFSDITDVERFEVQRKCFQIEDFPDVEKAKELYHDMISHKATAAPDDFRDLLDELKVGDAVKASMLNSYKTFLKIILDSKINQI